MNYPTALCPSLPRQPRRGPARAGADPVRGQAFGIRHSAFGISSLLGCVAAALLVLAGFVPGAAAADPKPDAASAPGLLGVWDGRMQFGKFSFRMVLRVQQANDGKIVAVMDMPDSGARNLPLGALLYNEPDVRLEFDQFGGTFNGKLDPGKDEIAGALTGGPGGKAMPVTFKRGRASTGPPMAKSYSSSPGQRPDLRGHWLSRIELQPGSSVRLALNIGHITNDTYDVTFDLLDFGMTDASPGTVAITNATIKFAIPIFQASFDGALEETGNRLSGAWTQGGQKKNLVFERMPQRATVLPPDLSFDAPGTAPDLRGYWKGTLKLPATALRLALKIGKTPAGEYAGSMISVDQGGSEIPATIISVTNAAVTMEWKPIRGKFVGTLAADGQKLDGKWSQVGEPTPLQFERTDSKRLTE